MLQKKQRTVFVAFPPPRIYLFQYCYEMLTMPLYGHKHRQMPTHIWLTGNHNKSRCSLLPSAHFKRTKINSTNRAYLNEQKQWKAYAQFTLDQLVWTCIGPVLGMIRQWQIEYLVDGFFLLLLVCSMEKITDKVIWMGHYSIISNNKKWYGFFPHICNFRGMAIPSTK